MTIEREGKNVLKWNLISTFNTHFVSSGICKSKGNQSRNSKTITTTIPHTVFRQSAYTTHMQQSTQGVNLKQTELKIHEIRTNHCNFTGWNCPIESNTSFVYIHMWEWVPDVEAYRKLVWKCVFLCATPFTFRQPWRHLSISVPITAKK